AGTLVARYEARGAPGLPHAQGDFMYAGDGGPGTPPAQPALDAGELLWLAERFATDAGSEALSRAERRARRSEAVACVNAVLRRMSPEAKAVAHEAVTSELGTELYRREPGRFERERLTAYRDALARQLDRFDAVPDARTRALAWAEVIREQVR